MAAYCIQSSAEGGPKLLFHTPPAPQHMDPDARAAQAKATEQKCTAMGATLVYPNAILQQEMERCRTEGCVARPQEEWDQADRTYAAWVRHMYKVHGDARGHMQVNRPGSIPDHRSKKTIETMWTGEAWGWSIGGVLVLALIILLALCWWRSKPTAPPAPRFFLRPFA